MLLPHVLFTLGMLSNHEVPVGTRLGVRLTTTVGSYASRAGTPVHAVLIGPVSVGDEAVLPAGSKLSGTVRSVKRVGFGFVHETAALDLEFNKVTLPNGEELPISARVEQVDNGREQVSRNGAIRGVRITACISYRVSGYIRMALLWHVHAQVAVWVIKSLLVQVPEPEIYYPAGSELTLALTQPLISMVPPEPARPARLMTPEERESLDPVIASMPQRTRTPVTDRPSDLVNVLFAGSREQLTSAFRAAGWTEAQPTTFRSGIRNIRAVAENKGYNEAPMSSLLLNNSEADMSWQKGLNDASKRHHIRVWKQTETWNGQELWLGAATRDIDFAYMRPGSWLTHKVDGHIDQERDKVLDDMAFTSCVDAVDWAERSGIPHVTQNATGDSIDTDARLATIRFGACRTKRKSDEAGDAPPVPMHGNIWQRFARREVLSMRNDLLRGNTYWRAYEGARWLVHGVHRYYIDSYVAKQQP